MWICPSLDTWYKIPFNFDVHSVLGFLLQLNSEISLYQNSVQNIPLINEGGAGEFSCSVLIYTREKMSFMPYLSMSVSSLSLLKNKMRRVYIFQQSAGGCSQLCVIS